MQKKKRIKLKTILKIKKIYIKKKLLLLLEYFYKYNKNWLSIS